MNNRTFRAFSLVFMVFLLCSCRDEYGRLTDFGVKVWIFFISLVVVTTLFIVVISRRTKRSKQRIEDVLAEQSDFTETKAFRGDSGTEVYYLGIDDTRNKALFILDEVSILFDYKDVVSAEIVENGNVVSKVSMGTIGRALLGGAIAGNVGAVLGGVSGIASSQSKVTSMKVHVLLRNQETPTFDITCLTTSNEMFYSPLLYKDASKKAHEILDTFKLMIDKACIDANNESKQKALVEQLKELAEMHKQGIINEDEFTALKQKLIGNDS